VLHNILTRLSLELAGLVWSLFSPLEFHRRPFQVLKFLKLLGNFYAVSQLRLWRHCFHFRFLRFVFGILIKKLSLVALQV